MSLGTSRSSAKEDCMKKIVMILVALGLAVSVAPAAYAGTPKTKAACEKAKMKWDDTAKTRSKP
jgi:hypothetical protein